MGNRKRLSYDAKKRELLNGTQRKASGVWGRQWPAVTAELLIEAAHGIGREQPSVRVDGGVENFNDAVNKLVDSGLLKRLLAQTEIQFSNSLIESWWRVLKHQWLYQNTLDTAANLRRLVDFYVDQHNRQLPHSAFRGQTPDEMYFKGDARLTHSELVRIALFGTNAFAKSRIRPATLRQSV